METLNQVSHTTGPLYVREAVWWNGRAPFPRCVFVHANIETSPMLMGSPFLRVWGCAWAWVMLLVFATACECLHRLSQAGCCLGAMRISSDGAV